MEKNTPKKKIFVFRFNSPMLIEVVKRLQKSNADVLYWEGSKKYFDAFIESTVGKTLFPNTIFHNTLRAVQGAPHESFSFSNLSVLDLDFVDKMSLYEAQILTMMSAVDYNKTPITKKISIYYDYLRYYKNLIEILKPDAILFGDVPHIAHQYTLFCIAKEMGIKTILCRSLQVRGRMIFTDDHRTYKELETVYINEKDKEHSIEELDEDVKIQYKAHQGSKEAAIPFYMKKKYINSMWRGAKIVPNFRKIILHIIKGTLFKVAPLYVKSFTIKKKLASLEPFELSGVGWRLTVHKWKKIRLSFKKEYERYTQEPDFSKKYIYVALHNQPEASTSAMGGVFVDQFLMIELLSKTIPKNWTLYVKESPMQWYGFRAHMGRYKNYYKKIAEIPNVVIIPTETDTFELIKHAKAVATVTGTVGWEAILRGVPVLVFGYIFYMFCDGVFRVRDYTTCREAIKQIRDGRKPNKQKIINFLYVLDKISTRAYPNVRFKQNLNITEEENIENITNAYIAELNT